MAWISPDVLVALLVAGSTLLLLDVVPMASTRHVGATDAFRRSAIADIGVAVRRQAGLETTSPDLNRLWGLSVVLLPLVVVHPALPVAGLLLVWGRHIARLRRHNITSAQQGWAAAPEAAQVMALAVRSGANVYQAIEVVAVRVPGRGGETFADVSRRLAMGVLLDEALAEVPLQLGEAGEPLRRAVRRCVTTGSELAPALERVAAELQAQQHQRQLEAARRLPVMLLFPLVTCTLPAFALLTVVPLLVGSLSRLAG